MMNTVLASPLAVKRVAAYARVSTLQEQQELSYETQCAYYKHLIESDPSMTLVGVYGDQGGSGLNMKKRPEFQRMMSDCLAGKIDLVMTKSISRFARNLADCVNCVRLLLEKGIPVMFEKEGINTTDPSSEMLLSVLATLAQEESRNISANIRWALDNRNASGNPARIARYGYRRSRDADGKVIWEIFEPEAERVRLAFSLASKGERYSEIIRQLNNFEIENGSDDHWTQSRVYEMLKSEVYIGDILTNKFYTSDYLTRRVVRNNGQRMQYFLEEHHKAIVDKATFERVSDLIHKHKLQTRKRRKQ